MIALAYSTPKKQTLGMNKRKLPTFHTKTIPLNDSLKNPWIDLVNFEIAYHDAKDMAFSKLRGEIDLYIQNSSHILPNLPKSKLFVEILGIILLLHKGSHTLLNDDDFSAGKQAKYLETIVRNIWQAANFLDHYINAYQKLVDETPQEKFLAQAQKLQHAFVFNATYELKTTHSIINLYNKLSQRHGALTESQTTAVAEITKGLSRLETFLDKADEYIKSKIQESVTIGA